MSRLLGDELVARAAECSECGNVGYLGQWLHGGCNWQFCCVHVVVQVAKYQVVCVLYSHDLLKHLA